MKEDRSELTEIAYRVEVRPSDCRNVRAIIESSGFFSGEETDVAVELVEENLRKGPASGYFFLFAELGGRVVGYGCFGPIAGTAASFDLYWIAVHNDLRGQGLGTEVLRQCEILIRGRGGRRIYVETSSRDQYRPTRRFYECCGYKMEAVLKDFYASGDDKVIFVKILE